MSHFVQHHLKDVLLDAFPWEAGWVQQFCWVTQQGLKSFQANAEMYFSVGKSTSLCKKVSSFLGAEVVKFSRKSHPKSNPTRSGSSTNCYRVLRFAGLEAQPLGKSPHKVHRSFPQMRDCDIDPLDSKKLIAIVISVKQGLRNPNPTSKEG